MGRPVAAIDVGTNTVLLLVAHATPDGSLVVDADVYRAPRLGMGVDARKMLHADAVARVIAVLKEYCTIAAAYAAEEIVVCGTSAVRDATNRDAFIRLVRDQTGLTLEVLTGEEEARWSFTGAISGLPVEGRAMVIDIGGGSTEWTLGDRQEITSRISLDIGAVRLTERFFRNDPPTPHEIRLARHHVATSLEALPLPTGRCGPLIGVAGTPTSLATLALGLKTFSRETVSGCALHRHTIEALWDQLSQLPSTAIRALSEVMDGRADVITAGTLILRQAMDRLDVKELTVSDRGLRYGLVARALHLPSHPGTR